MCIRDRFLGIGLDEQTPDHSTISRTRRLIDVETHRKVFFWILELLRDKGLVKGKTVGIDATTLEMCIRDSTSCTRMVVITCTIALILVCASP